MYSGRVINTSLFYGFKSLLIPKAIVKILSIFRKSEIYCEKK